MTSEDIVKLALDLQTTQDPAEIARKVTQLKEALAQVGETYELLERQVGEYGVVEERVSKRTKEYSEEQAQSRRAVNQIIEESIAEQRALATSVETTADAHKKMGRGVLQTSYAVQDFTSVLAGGRGLSLALGSVQNNIPVLLTGLGVGAGLAGTISLVSVGLGAAIPLLLQFAGAEDKASEATKKLTEESERLRNLPSDAAAQSKANLEAFLKSLPASAVQQGIRTALTARARSQAAQQIEEEYQETGAVTDTIEARMKRWEPQIEADVNRAFVGMTTNEQDAGFVASLAQQTPGAFPKGFLQAFTAARRGIGGPEKDAAAERAGEAEIKRGQEKAVEELKKRAERRQQIAEAAQKEKEKNADEVDRATEWADKHAKEQAARAKEQAQRDAHAVDVATRQAEEHQRREAEIARKAAARENTAERQKERAIAAEIGRQGGGGADPDFVKEVASQASKNVTLGADIAQAVHMAVQQTQMKIQQDFLRQMQRQEAWSETRIW